MTELENQEIKKRARRRLVGSIALVILAAIVLPIMMDHEPHSSVQDIQVTIPDRNVAAGMARGAPASETITAPLDDAPAVPAGAADKPAVPSTMPLPGAPASPATASDAPVSPPAAAVAPAPARPVAPAPRPAVPSAEEEARVKAILSGQTPPPRPEAFVIQIGAFSDASKATRLAAELKAKGFPAYTELVGGVTRVRVGPINGRSAADASAARLKAAGHQAVIQPR